jgi:hypothetical protein
MSYIVRSDHIAITSGNASTTGSKDSWRVAAMSPDCELSRCVILATRTVATGRFGKVIRASHRTLSFDCRRVLYPNNELPISSKSAPYGACMEPQADAPPKGCDCGNPPSRPLPPTRRPRLSASPRRSGGDALPGYPDARELRRFCATSRCLGLIPESLLDNRLRELLTAE